MNYKKRHESLEGIVKKIARLYFKKEKIIQADTLSNNKVIVKYSDEELLAIDAFLSQHNIVEWDVVYNRKLIVLLEGKIYSAIAHFTKDKVLYAVNLTSEEDKKTLKRIIKTERILAAVNSLIEKNTLKLLEMEEKSRVENDYVFWNLSVHSFFGHEIKFFVKPLLDYGFSDVIPKTNGVLIKS